ncbi:hypothetical protein [Brachybacterium sp. 107]|uniref:hypothetical protein n=1 Tax=Brachybacterium sp. 107 TaxID=3457736 RepID=UPI00403409BA
MTDPAQLLAAAHHVLLHNWPSTDVPHTLARAGFAVTVFGGPAPDDVSVTELVDGQILDRWTGVRPESADVLYVYPWPGFELERDLPDVARTARELGAGTLWFQSALTEDGSQDDHGTWVPEDDAARIDEIGEAEGLSVVRDAYIADVARELGAGRG